MDILFNDESIQEEFNIHLAERPYIPVAQPRYEEYGVPGRNGTLKRLDGYDNVGVDLRFNYIDKDAKDIFDEIVNWLHYRDRYQESDSDKYRIIAEPVIDVSPANNDFYDWVDFEIHLEFEPFKYEDAGTIEVTDEETVVNPSNIEAEAIMRVYGEGTCRVMVNDNHMEFIDVDEITIVNGIKKVVESRTGRRLDNQMEGQFPVLQSGENTIEVSGNAERIEIDLRWCWR